MNTSSSGSAWVDDTKGPPEGEVRGRTNPVKFLKRVFAAAPEGTAVLFFIDSLPPSSSPLRGYVHLAPLPAGSIQIFSMLGFVIYHSTSLC